ncbi:OmpA family protein [Marivita sp. S0852]|uniref:OmpA family protein n=1 Tax=Marivita sp. S0852 TaxID=3373893 RepID=UPI003981A1A7
MAITRNRADWGTGLLSAVCLLIGSAVSALDLSLPIGARETVAETSPHATYALPLGPWNEATGVPTALLEGEVMRKAWRISGAGMTTGQVIGPLRTQLASGQYDVIFDCTAQSCGGFDFRFGIEVLPAPDMYVDLTEFHFLSAKTSDATQALSLLVSRDGDSVFVQLIEIGPPGRSGLSVSATAVPPVAANTGNIVSQLETAGHAVLSDLDFASGSASLGTGPLASLDAIVAYLTANPTREITFVGHTDATGSLAANVALSRRRAQAVQSYIVQRGVPAAQVAADGVGYLSPRASNLTPEGREANRRVEAVLISVE